MTEVHGLFFHVPVGKTVLPLSSLSSVCIFLSLSYFGFLYIRYFFFENGQKLLLESDSDDFWMTHTSRQSPLPLFSNQVTTLSYNCKVFHRWILQDKEWPLRISSCHGAHTCNPNTWEVTVEEDHFQARQGPQSSRQCEINSSILWGGEERKKVSKIVLLWMNIKWLPRRSHVLKFVFLAGGTTNR